MFINSIKPNGWTQQCPSDSFANAKVGFKLKDYNLADTIAAIATFPSKSALGVVKISGPRAFKIISKIFVSKKKKDFRKVKTHTLHYGWIIDRLQNPNTRHRTPSIVDEVLVSVMRKPASYTKEDVIEISSHGSVFVLNKILEIVLKEEARLALPGEFTYRALVRGRIDLLQAESILSVVDAVSFEGLNDAGAQLRGEVSERIKRLKEQIKDIFVQTEAYINFPEDQADIFFGQIKENVKDIEIQLNNLLAGSREATILKEGVRCVICGKTNVGKSTLFNRLLKQERVIVSKFPGTTRDVIEETINIKGIPLRIYDTAGILEPKDFVAKEAIEKTSQLFSEADLVVIVIDGAQALDKDDLFLLERAKEKNVILAINKIDMKQKIRLKDMPKINGDKVKVSALRNIGIDDLEKAVYKSVYRKGVNRQDMIFLNQLQRQILEQTIESISKARKFLERGYTIDFVNLSLKESLDNLGKITGEVLSEEILESIFSNFCIGK